MTGTQKAARRNELEASVLARLLDAGDPQAEATVTIDPYKGFRFRVISSAFSGRSPAERKNLALTDIDDEDIAFIELLSLEEATFLGNLDDQPSATDASNQIPLWPESLIRGQEDCFEVRLPSRMDEFLEAPLITTFYSLRGGVGRSTALAHTALHLARSHRVLLIDMDLEAPGLAALLDVESEVGTGQGVVPLLLQAEIEASEPDIANHLIRVGDDVELYLLPAGRPDADYARQLAQLDPSSWYHEHSNPLRQLMGAVAKLRLAPQVVLIDARTGISPLSAPLLFDLADIAVITFFPHPQARLGTRALTRALLASRSGRSREPESYTPEPRFLISPIPGAGAPQIRKRYEERAATWVSEWLDPARLADGSHAFEDVDELIHVVGYSEDIAASDTVGLNTGSNYSVVANWIAGFIPQPADEDTQSSSFETTTASKPQILEELQFSVGTAEAQSDVDFEETFLRTDVVERAMRDDIPLVIGRKGTGKTALFRKLAAEHPNSVVVVSPPGLPTRQAWMPESASYAAIDRSLADAGLDWRAAWPLIIGIAIRLKRMTDEVTPWPDAELIADSRPSAEYTTLDFVSDLRRMARTPDSSLLGWDWLRRFDGTLSEPTLLLFDGLDTGFGLNEEDLARRKSAISGLLNFLGARGDDLRNLKMKVMLREDLWRSVPVPNKSHFYGRDARLAWSEQVDYLKVAIKQAVRAPRIAQLFEERLASAPRSAELPIRDVELWPSDQVYGAWRVLVGERISGGKTAFTYNWVWSRLSDANDNHAPRALLQLLNSAVRRERQLHPSNPYERSILRPRALVESLDEVSDEAVTALSEEFSELAPLFSALTDIGRTPFLAQDLNIDPGVETLGREVGLLAVEAGTRDEVERYRVPELYRKALGMGRRGQA